MIFSLDISSSITGWSVADKKEKKIIDFGTLDFRNKDKFTSLYVQFKFAKDFFRQLKTKYAIDRIVVESPLQMFSVGMSSAGVIAILQRFNGMVCAAAYDVFEVEPELLSAATCRSWLGIKVPRELKKDKAKMFIAECIEHRVPSFKISRTKQGNAVAGTFDIADAIVLALYEINS